jgi:hypothetical protein
MAYFPGYKLAVWGELIDTRMKITEYDPYPIYQRIKLG